MFMFLLRSNNAAEDRLPFRTVWMYYFTPLHYPIILPQYSLLFPPARLLRLDTSSVLPSCSPSRPGTAMANPNFGVCTVYI